MSKITFTYHHNSYEMIIKEKNSIKKILNKYITNLKENIDDFLFLYKGKNLNNLTEIFKEINKNMIIMIFKKIKIIKIMV